MTEHYLFNQIIIEWNNSNSTRKAENGKKLFCGFPLLLASSHAFLESTMEPKKKVKDQDGEIHG